MAESGDLIDFAVIETQKENIQSLPGGRSAKQLSQLCGPLSAIKSPPLSQSVELKNQIRQDFEKELLTVAEADDPLEIYDRYVKWTADAYPSAQATPESGLLPLLERATKTFLTSPMYKNDPRYLKMWLLYIRLFADSPRETYAYLAKQGIGEGLALFYEEFAAWLEGAGRWSQAEEVYASGLDMEARPAERLLRKFAEFQHRRDTKPESSDGPSSPALPKIRPALMAKTDPFAGALEENDPQARDRAAAAGAASSGSSRPGRAKLSVFADGDEPAQSTSSGSGQAWDNIGSLAERKKENIREAKPWAGEKLDGGKKLAGGPKMSIFRDPSLGNQFNEKSSSSSATRAKYITVNERTGKPESVFVDLEAVYPDGAEHNGEEFCFEELRARHRGWLERDWSRVAPVHIEQKDLGAVGELRRLSLPSQTAKLEKPAAQPVKDENADKVAMPPPQSIPVKDESSSFAKKARREERANRTRKIVVEVRAETHTVQTNLDSPTGPKIRKKKSAEPTMTIHTKEAMNEVYDIFNQPLKPITEPEEDNESEDESDDEDDYTSAGESTGTGRISTTASEFGDDTGIDFTTSSRTEEVDISTQQSVTGSEWSENNTGTGYGSGEDLSEVHLEVEPLVRRDLSTESEEQLIEVDEVITPVSPKLGDSPEEYINGLPAASRSAGGALAMRAAKGMSRLPFMTPIVEKTESSIGAATALAHKNFTDFKTPSRESNNKSLPHDDPWSSPFEDETYEYDKENEKIPQPALLKSNRPKQPLEVSKSHPAQMKEPVQARPHKGPIILDAQCNPMDEAIRSIILTQVHPPLDSYSGYHRVQGSSSGKGAEIRKYVKALAKTGKANGEKTATNLNLPPTLKFDGTKRAYAVRRELGRGAFAPVYLVDSELLEDQDEKIFGVQRNPQEVIKMEDPPSSWEFYMISQAKRRLGVSRPSDSIVEAYEMHVFDDECFLVEEYRNQGTLLDAVNSSRAEANCGSAMEEQLAMFFTIEIFRTVEALHSKGVIHGDLKADNVLIRLDTATSDASWEPQYSRDGSGGWSEQGITLIDFGRGIDMKVFKPDVQFVADWKTSEADCAEMREMRPWTFQADYHGLAGIVHSMLFGKYMETVGERGSTLGAGATKSYKIREGLKRYWQTDIWNDVFEVLLNPLTHLDAEEGTKLPLLKTMRLLRERLEAHLESNCEKGVGLKALLRRLDGALRERKK